jgi:hypothetical protein
VPPSVAEKVYEFAQRLSGINGFRVEPADKLSDLCPDQGELESAIEDSFGQVSTQGHRLVSVSDLAEAIAAQQNTPEDALKQRASEF